MHAELPINNYLVCQLFFFFNLQDILVSFLLLSGFNVIAHTVCAVNK